MKNFFNSCSIRDVAAYAVYRICRIHNDSAALKALDYARYSAFVGVVGMNFYYHMLSFLRHKGIVFWCIDYKKLS